MAHGSKHSDGKKVEHRTPDASHIRNPDVSHEASDVNVGAIAKFIAGLFIGTVVAFAITAALFWYLSSREQRNEPEVSPLARRSMAERMPQDAPRLQSAPTHQLDGENLELREPQAEMRVLRRVWERELNARGVDPNTGANRIPIEEAKRMVAESGLRSRAASGDGQVQGYEEMPTYQSSGRVMDRRMQ